MVTFEVTDMTCGHCVSAITKAVRSVDRSAKVEVDLHAHQVRIESTEADAQEFSEAIAEAGYTPVPIAGAAPASATPVRRGGCCCG